MAQAVSLDRDAVSSAVRSNLATVNTTVLAVENMHCGNCIRKVEATLTRQAGVRSARVNLSGKRVSVLAEGVPAIETWVAALSGQGYKAVPLSPNVAAPTARFEAQDLKRLGVAGFAAANIMLLSVAVWSGDAGDMPASQQSLFHWLSALIAIPAIAYAGQPFFISARHGLAARRLNMDVPISIGVLLATAMSLYQTIVGSPHVYFDASVMLLFFLLIGRALDQSVRARAASAAENLLNRRPIAATALGVDGGTERIAVGDIKPGMRLLIAAGEQVPVDGTLVSAIASLDESIVTGESHPLTAGPGTIVHAGSVALSGPFEIESIAAADDSLVAEIARLMQTAEQARGRFVRLADRAASIYAPAVHILGALTFVGWMLAGVGWETSLLSAISVLIITCPCALALAVPVVQVVATSRLFKSGIVVKSPDALERFAEVDWLVFDKTGTVTLGRPDLDAPSLDDGIVGLAAGLARGSRHPYAQAVVREAQRRGLVPASLADVREAPGAGVEGIRDGHAVRLGSATFCGAHEHDVDRPAIWFRDGDTPAIPLPMQDALRSDASAVMSALSRQGYGLELLSGDSPSSVAVAAHDLGLTRWSARQKPDEKIERLHALAAQGHKVLMVGDGLNDAPALAVGHASLSPSSATDISQMAADAVFQGERLRPVAICLTVAKAARQCALENFAIAIGYNAIFVPLAMAGRVTPFIAAIAMSASSIAVTLNSLRLSRSSTEMAP